jgi:hypothetical protein
MNQESLKIDLGELSSSEKELIHYIRTRFRYGEIVIETRDGRPFRIRKMTEFQTLS